MKKTLISLLMFVTISAQADFLQGQVLIATGLNAAIASPTIIGGTITGLYSPIPIGSVITGSAPTNSATTQLQHIQGGKGSVARTVTNNLQDTVNVRDFGAVCNGTVNDTPAFLAAAQSLSGGGTVKVPAIGKCLIDTSITLPPNVTLKGGYTMLGSPGSSNASAPYGNVLGSIQINSGATIYLSGGAGIDGLLLYRKGMTFPAADSSAFSGTAVTASGEDTFLANSMVLGFNKAFYSSGFQRPRVLNNWLDNINGIEIAACYDVAQVANNQAWPYATIAAAGASTKLQRPGIAYYFHDGGDWNKSTNNFSYGYFRGHKLTNVNSMTLLNVSHDNTTTFAGSIGIVVDGTSTDTRIIGGQSAAQAIGIYINTSSGTHTQIADANTWVNSANSVLIDSGDVNIQGAFRDAPYGVTINNASSKVSIHRSRFNNISGVPIHNVLASPYIDLGINDYGNLANGVSASDNITPNSIASANPLQLPPTGEFFNVTGTTSFGNVKGGWIGRKVTLSFAGAVTVNNGGAAPNSIVMLDATSYTTSTGSTISLIYNGTKWVELGRRISGPSIATSLNINSTNGLVGAIIITDKTESGSNLKLIGNGATTPSKSIRVNGGTLQVVNDAYSAVLMQITDAGRFSVNSGADDGTNALQVTGNAAIKSVGAGFRVAEGVNAKQLLSAAMVSGSVTVFNNSVTATSRIICTRQAGGTNAGAAFISAVVVGTSFTVTSTNTADTGQVACEIFEQG